MVTSFSLAVLTCIILCVGQLKDAETEIAKVMQSRQEAEQQISASKVKMEVLSNIFKDKEKELMRFVGLCHLPTTVFSVLAFCQTRSAWMTVNFS